MSGPATSVVQQKTADRDLLRIFEWSLAILLTLAAISLLVARVVHAGPLWRDECATVQLASMPTVTQVLQNFQRESFPAFFYLLVRAYEKLAGTSDPAFRTFGLAVGVTLIGAIWFNARRLTGNVPILSLSLLALNPSFIIWGTTMRGYGIGSVLILVAFGAIAVLLVNPSKVNFAVSTLICVAAVHLVLPNSVLLAVFAVAVVAVSWFNRELRPIWLITIIGGICFASILPNLLAFRYESKSTIVLQGAVDIPWFWEQLCLSLGTPARLLEGVWIACTLFVLSGGFVTLRRIGREVADARLLIFSMVVLGLSVPAYFGFLKVVSYRTREWYYLALLAVLAAAIDLIGGLLIRWKVARILRVVIGAFALCVIPIADWPNLLPRQTNMDQVAQKLANEAGPNDLIVCNPWYLGVSFNRYYRGKARWITSPNLNDHTVHRFDLVKDKEMLPSPLNDVFESIRETLEANNRVWIVGDLTFLRENESPVILDPAPDRHLGWNCDAYADAWSQQLGTFFQQHAATGGYVTLESVGPVNELETVNLLVAQGWIGYGGR